MNLKNCASGLVLILALATVSLAQGASSTKDGCSVLDATRSAQFIVYEGKSESDIHLRLRNNSSCAIVVETDDRYPTEIKKLPQGGGRIESVLESRDGIRLPLHYLIQNKPQSDWTRAYGWGDSVFAYEIPAGQSITFAVPASLFKRRYNIAVPFGYAWEGKNSIAIGIGSVVHQVQFLFEDLPPVALR
jgi:hypothetical protein